MGEDGVMKAKVRKNVKRTHEVEIQGKWGEESWKGDIGLTETLNFHFFIILFLFAQYHCKFEWQLSSL